MASLIRSPRLSSTPRLLHTPRRWSEGAPTAASTDPKPPSLGIESAGGDVAAVDVAALEARLAAAEERAETVTLELGALQEDLERRRAEAVERGLGEGREDAARQASAENAEKLQQIGACLEVLHARMGERLAHEEDAIAEAVFAAIVKLLGDSLVTREGVAAAVRSVCRHIEMRDSLRVRLSPRDHDLLSCEMELLRPLPANVRLEPDPSIDLGGCIVDVDGQTLDGRIEVQLDKLRAALRRARAGIEEDER